MTPVAARAREMSAPEIKVGYAPAGRETLAAIAEELAMAAAIALSGDTRDSAPDIELGVEIALERSERTPAGALDLQGRQRQSTKSYGDRVSNAPGATVPGPSARQPAQAFTSSPEITLSQSPAGRETLAAIGEELSEPVTGVRPTLATIDFAAPRARADFRATRDAPGPEITIVDEAGEIRDGGVADSSSILGAAPAALQIYEMITFVVKGADAERLASQGAGRDFVAERLRQRLPITDLEDVERIEVTPWSVRGTVIIRVWCRVHEVVPRA